MRFKNVILVIQSVESIYFEINLLLERHFTAVVVTETAIETETELRLAFGFEAESGLKANAQPFETETISHSI